MYILTYIQNAPLKRPPPPFLGWRGLVVQLWLWTWEEASHWSGSTTEGATPQVLEPWSGEAWRASFFFFRTNCWGGRGLKIMGRFFFKKTTLIFGVLKVSRVKNFRVKNLKPQTYTRGIFAPWSASLSQPVQRLLVWSRKVRPGFGETPWARRSRSRMIRMWEDRGVINQGMNHQIKRSVCKWEA